MIQLASKDQCTSCGACAYVCPKKCITMSENELGIVYPVMDDTDCISCKRCQKVCPILTPLEPHEPKTAFAAWSCDEEERRTSASGGVAAEVYKEALREGYHIAGAKQNEDFTVTLQVSDQKEAIEGFKNSKYVFSSAYTLYPEIKNLLKQGEKVLVIGLPCQIAALRRIFREHENLLLMEVVCHGTTPHSYLMQHIHALEHKTGEKAVRMSFRNPEAYTYTFTFTLYNAENQRFYAQRTKNGDTYKFGYHRTVTYRENCYHCHFARDKRIADVTLSDYKGLGKMAPCSHDNTKVSSVLVNTPRGEAFVKLLIDANRIVAEERPVREPIEGDLQLRQPSIKKSTRFDFEKLIVKNKGDFEKTMNAVMMLHEKREKRMRILNLPRKAVRKLKRIILGK